jgi:hypothetical protein
LLIAKKLVAFVIFVDYIVGWGVEMLLKRLLIAKHSIAFLVVENMG